MKAKESQRIERLLKAMFGRNLNEIKARIKVARNDYFPSTRIYGHMLTGKTLFQREIFKAFGMESPIETTNEQCYDRDSFLVSLDARCVLAKTEKFNKDEYTEHLLFIAEA